MSLKLAKAFVGAIRNNEALLRTLGAKGNPLSGARIFTASRPETEDKADKLPYIIVMPQGINTRGNKDEYDCGDNATVDVLVVGTADPNEFVNLAQTVRDTIEDNLTGDNDFTIDDYTFSASPLMYDEKKPCYFQTLTYNVNTQKI